MKKITLENGKVINISEESYKALTEGISNKILVPKCITIEKRFFGDGLGIVFNNKQQTLNYEKGIYLVKTPFERDFVQCELIPCDEEDIQEGDTFFMSAFKEPDFSELRYYAKKLRGDEYVYVNNKNVIVDTCSWSYYYKVVEVEE